MFFDEGRFGLRSTTMRIWAERGKQILVKVQLSFKNISFIILPAYSPELNPVEKLWEWIKKECIHNFIYDSLDDMMDAVCNEFKKLDATALKKLCNCNYLSYYI